MIPSADLFERLNGRPYMVNAIPHEAAVNRVIGTLLLKQNDERQLQRRDMQLEGLQQLVDNQPARVSAELNWAGTARVDEPVDVDLHHSVRRDP